MTLNIDPDVQELKLDEEEQEIFEAALQALSYIMIQHELKVALFKAPGFCFHVHRDESLEVTRNAPVH